MERKNWVEKNQKDFYANTTTIDGGTVGYKILKPSTGECEMEEYNLTSPRLKANPDIAKCLQEPAELNVLNYYLPCVNTSRLGDVSKKWVDIRTIADGCLDFFEVVQIDVFIKAIHSCFFSWEGYSSQDPAQAFHDTLYMYLESLGENGILERPVALDKHNNLIVIDCFDAQNVSEYLYNRRRENPGRVLTYEEYRRTGHGKWLHRLDPIWSYVELEGDWVKPRIEGVEK